MIYCSGQLFDHHTAVAFEDAPFSSPEIMSNAVERPLREIQARHLNGAIGVSDIVSYMKRNDDVAIVIVRQVRCAENMAIHANAEGLKWHESLAAKSKTLRTALASVARCYYNVSQDTGARGPASHSSEVDQFQISPARLFLFHHHSALRTHALTYPDTESHIYALIAYCDNRYGPDFAEALRLFQGGVVVQKHLSKLFMPNEVVISSIDGHLRAFMVQEWPETDANGRTTLRCWSWRSDGARFVRKATNLQLPPLEGEYVRIQSLHAYPIDFATSQTKELLESRGRKQWSLRRSSHVSYTGWNVSRDQYYVRVTALDSRLLLILCSRNLDL